MKEEPAIIRGLVGRWVSSDQSAPSVLHRVSTWRGKYRVAVVDQLDDERADVHDINWDGETLRYCVHWASTGRRTKNALTLLGDSQVLLTYTHTDAEILVKKREA